MTQWWGRRLIGVGWERDGRWAVRTRRQRSYKQQWLHQRIDEWHSSMPSLGPGEREALLLRPHMRLIIWFFSYFSSIGFSFGTGYARTSCMLLKPSALRLSVQCLTRSPSCSPLSEFPCSLDGLGPLHLYYYLLSFQFNILLSNLLHLWLIPCFSKRTETSHKISIAFEIHDCGFSHFGAFLYLSCPFCVPQFHF